jgi:hypothetical protein
VVRARDGHDARRVAGGRPEQRRAADVDQLHRLIDADDSPTDFGRERLDVDDDEIDRADAVGVEFLELGRNVAAGEDPGVDRRMERLDLMEYD